MLFDRLIHQWLGNGGIVYLAVAVPAVADQVDDYVAAKGVPIFKGHAAYAYYRIHIFTIDVEDGDGLAAGDLCRKA